MIDLALARDAMADRLAATGFPPAVIGAMRRVPRHAFVPERFWRLAYAETDLCLGLGSLPAPGATARAVAALALRPGQRVLEIGTGRGYQTALLAALGARVFTVETAGGYDLSEGALARLGGEGIARSLGGGLDAWRADAPFDAIVANDPMPLVPAALLAQLAPETGRLVAVLGAPGLSMRLVVARASADGAARWRDLGPWRAASPAAAAWTPFVAPMGGTTEP